MSYTRFDQLSDQIVALHHELEALSMSPRKEDEERGDAIGERLTELYARRDALKGGEPPVYEGEAG